MERSRGRRGAIWVAGLALLVILGGILAPLLIGHEFRWSGTLAEIDIHSGRIRTSRYLLRMRLREKVHETVVSRALAGTQQGVTPEWHPESSFATLGPGWSPHYYYHGAATQLHLVSELFGCVDFSDEGRRVVAQTLVELWKKGGSGHAAGQYINGLFQLAFDASDRGADEMDVARLKEFSATRLEAIEPSHAPPR